MNSLVLALQRWMYGKECARQGHICTFATEVKAGGLKLIVFRCRCGLKWDHK